MTMNQTPKCPATNNITGSQCQLDADHATNDVDGGHVFPLDDAFLRALDDGDIIIGRPPKSGFVSRLCQALAKKPQP